MQEVKIAINNIIVELSRIHQTMKSLDSALASYVEFKGDEEKWRKWVDKKIKESNGKANEKSSENNKKSSGGK